MKPPDARRGVRRVLVALASFALAAGLSWLKLRFQCRQPGSEACVWGKAFFAVTLPVETLVVGVAILLALAVVQRWGR